MTVLASLGQCRLFSGLGEHQLRTLATFAWETEVPEGEVVFREGERARCLYAVVRGRVALAMRVQPPDGGPARLATVATLGPGEAFGWSAIVEPHVMTLTARAVEPSTLLVVEGDTLREVLRRYRDVGYLVMAALARLLGERLGQTRQALIYERGWAWVA